MDLLISMVALATASAAATCVVALICLATGLPFWPTLVVWMAIALLGIVLQGAYRFIVKIWRGK